MRSVNLSDFLRLDWRSLIAVFSVGVWLYALTQTAYVRVFEYFEGLPVDPRSIERTSGFDCLLTGWIAPLGALQSPEFGHPLPPGYREPPFIGIGNWSLANIAWYANLFWGWNVLRCLQGQSALVLPALCGVLLSGTAWQTAYISVFDDHGVATRSSPGTAIYIWIFAVSVPLVIAALDLVLLAKRGRQP